MLARESTVGVLQMGLLTRTIKLQRLNMVAPYIQGDVLDVGCGQAEIIECFQETVASYTGIELHKANIDKLKNIYDYMER